jgi:CRP-like cAMP-binding protein
VLTGSLDIALPHFQVQPMASGGADLNLTQQLVQLRGAGRGGMVLSQPMAQHQRLAGTAELLQRLNARGFSQSELVLRMTREEIGSYLGLKLETVSRTFSKFVGDGTLEVKQRHVRILNPDALKLIVKTQNCQPI